jgi:SET domain-containing protein
MSVIIKPSRIHGVGVFTVRSFAPNDFIFTAIDENKKITDLGSKINHSWQPNTHLLFVNNEWNIYASGMIEPGEELTANYNKNKPNFIKPAIKDWV